MPWTNYHSHTHFCDGSNPVPDYLKRAEELGMAAYGYSSHAPTPWESCAWAMRMEKLPEYLRQVNALKETSPVQVYTSLEIDYVPDRMGPSSPWIKEAELDYTLASVHFVDFHEDGSPWEIDGPQVEWEKGLDGIFKGDVRRAVERYFELTRHMVAHDCPQIIGHVDKIKMQNFRKPYFDENADWYRNALFDTLEAIANTDAIVEVNTRGMYKKRTSEPYPGREGLLRIRELGIPIMLNSDGHHPDEIIREFEVSADLLLELGFRELWAFIDGQFQPFAFDRTGLKIG